jgi:hypothetical protein
MPETVNLVWNLIIYYPTDGEYTEEIARVELDRSKKLTLLGAVSSFEETFTQFEGYTIELRDSAFIDAVTGRSDGKLMFVLEPVVDNPQSLSQKYVPQNFKDGDYYVFGQYYGFTKEHPETEGDWEKRNYGNPMTSEFQS